MAMVAIRFRLDRNRGKCINIVHMLNIPLPSYKTMDVKAFVDKVRLCLVNLSTEELKDKQLLYQWLYEKLRRYNAIQNKLDKIRESRTGSRKRTWGYLWGAITSYLDNLYEDDNYDNLALGLQHHKINAAPAQKTRADKRQKATEAKTHTDREQTAARSRSDALQQPSQLSKRAQKKSEKATSAAAAASGATASFGGKGSKGKSAGKGKAESDPTDPASVARSKPHDERTTEEKRLIPCRFEALGTCYAGNNCAYSHDKKLIAAVKAKAKPKSKMAAAKKTLATVASMAGLGADGAVTTTIPTPSKPAWHSSAAVLKCVAKHVAKPFLPALIGLGATTGIDTHRAIATSFAAVQKTSTATMPLHTFDVEYINDSGAGRSIFSIDALAKQNVPSTVLNKLVGPATEHVEFETGGGAQKSAESIGITSALLGRTECYKLAQSPIAISMGEVINKQQRPLIWMPGQLPYHVTDPTKVKVMCPLRFRNYANRLEDNVPIWRESLTLHPSTKAVATTNYLASALSCEDGTHGGYEYLCLPVGVADIDENLTVADVPCEGTPEEVINDATVRTRSMSRRALILEAQSPEHLMAHFPHNPFCEICVRAHMRQRRAARTTPAQDDQLSAVKEPRKVLGADTMIVAKSATDGTRTSASGSSVSFTIRDQYSGMGLGFPQTARTKNDNYKHLKFFVGLAGHRPDVMVKSDAAKEITSAVEELGWHPEPSLQNKWPHNATHERWIGTHKSVIRANMLQSGFPEPAWDWSVPYSSIALSVRQRAPIHAWEKDAAGNVQDQYKHKEGLTCWEVHHNGDKFLGPSQPFGRLMYYLNRAGHPLMPTTAPGLFVGWRLENGIRYRGVLMVADYEAVRTNGFLRRHIKSVPDKEVYFPADTVFPFAEARSSALRNLQPTAAPPPAAEPQVLPFADEAGEEATKEGTVPAPPPLPPPRFKITFNRILEYGQTPDCVACTDYDPTSTRTHTNECRARFAKLLGKDGPPTRTITAVEPISDPETTEAANNEEVFENAGQPSNLYGLPLQETTSKSATSAPGNGCSSESKSAIAAPGNTSLNESKSATSAPGNGDSKASKSATSAPGDVSQRGKAVTFDMEDYCQQCVEHYLQVTGEKDVKAAVTPFCPDGTLVAADDEIHGQLGDKACSVLMKDLWLARLARPYAQKAICDIATKVQNWTRNDDKRIRRLMGYLKFSKSYKLTGRINDPPEDLELWLFVDADFCGDYENTRSTSGG